MIAHKKLIGSHNSAAANLGDDSIKLPLIGAIDNVVSAVADCQTLSIKEQLAIGVKVFDIRVRLPDLVVCHGAVVYKITLSEILNEIRTYLMTAASSKTTESDNFLLIFLKSESSTCSVDEGVRLTRATLEAFADHISTPDSALTDENVRGKISIFTRSVDCFVPERVCFMHGWADNATSLMSTARGNLFVQDKYDASREDKKVAVGEALEKCARETPLADALCIHFLSRQYKVLQDVSIEHSAKLDAPYYNNLIHTSNRGGIFMVDFVDKRTVEMLSNAPSKLSYVDAVPKILVKPIRMIEAARAFFSALISKKN